MIAAKIELVTSDTIASRLLKLEFFIIKNLRLNNKNLKKCLRREF